MLSFLIYKLVNGDECKPSNQATNLDGGLENMEHKFLSGKAQHPHQSRELKFF